MKRALVIGVGMWITLAAALAIWFSPSPVIRQVSVVYLIWFYSNLANWALLGMMAAPCALTLKEVAGRDARVRHAIYLGMQNRTFWIGFWGSALAWVINTLAPLLLLVYLPTWVALGAFALNLLVLNSAAVPVRLWLWRIHTQDEVPA